VSELSNIADELAALRKEGIDTQVMVEWEGPFLEPEESKALQDMAVAVTGIQRVLEHMAIQRAGAPKRFDWMLCLLFVVVAGIGILLGVIIGG
jgi:hypothetical protein